MNEVICKINSLISAGKLQEALTLAYEYCHDFRQDGDNIGYARMRSLYAKALCMLSRYDEATEAYAEAREIFMAFDVQDGVADVEFGLGELYYNRTDYEASMAAYKRARKIYLDLGIPLKSAQSSMRTAQALMSSGKFKEALELARASRQVFVELSDEALVAQADKIIGTILWYLDEYQDALGTLQEAYERFSRLGLTIQAALVDNNRALIYWKLNLYHEALSLFIRAREVLKQTGMDMEVATISINMAMVYTSIGEYDQASECLKTGRDICRSRGITAKEAWCDYYMAKVEILQGRYDEAIECLENARRIFEKQGIEVYINQVDLYRAIAYLESGQADRAIPLYESALQCGIAHNVPDMIFPALYGLGRAKQNTSPDEAFAYFSRAVETIESLRRGLSQDALKTGFVQDKMRVYDSIIDLSLRKGETERAFEYVERAKSQALSDLVEQGRLIGSHLPAENAERRRGEELLPRRLSPSDIQKSCGHDMAILDYYLDLGSGALAIFYITRQGIQVHVDPDGQRKISDILNWLSYDIRIMESSSRDFISANMRQLLSSHNQNLRRLHDLLINPFKEELGWMKRILIIPHGTLHRVPFHALYDGSSYLIDTHEVFYSPCGRIFQLCLAAPKRKMNTCLVVGVPADDLRFVEHECKQVASLFAGTSPPGVDPRGVDPADVNPPGVRSALLLLASDASGQRVKDALQRSDVIHIACHSRFRSDNPMFSYLSLADSQLTASELFEIKMTASLVTLSACETGKVEVLQGDELIGFIRGLLYAGAPSILVSLWKANDESTSWLMKEFYGTLLTGGTKSGALRRAQLSLKETLKHPYYWAPFSLIGNPD